MLTSNGDIPLPDNILPEGTLVRIVGMTSGLPSEFYGEVFPIVSYNEETLCYIIEEDIGGEKIYWYAMARDIRRLK